MRERGLRSTEVRLAVGLAVVVAAIRIWVARPLAFCGTPDACYYLGMAQNLASGQGFHARFLYDFQQAHLTLPNTGIEYWRPGISLILLVLRPLGVTLHTAVALTVLVGILYAAAAWHIAMRAFGDRRIALGSFALCLLSSPGWVGSLTPDSGLYYGAAVAWFLALFTVRRQGLAQDVVALGCVCITYLVRNDAVLLLIPLLAVLWARHRMAAGEPGGAAARGSSAAYAAVMLVGFCVALAPMHVIYKAVLGTAFPGGTAQALYINDLSDFGRYKDPVSLHTLLAHGIKHLVLFRIETLCTVLYRIAALMVGYAALVFLPGLLVRESGPRDEAGAAVRRHLPELIGPGVFFATAILVYALALPAIGGFSALRTAMGVMPFVSVLVMVGIVRVARTPRIAMVLGTAVILVNAVSGFMDDRRQIPVMNGIGAADRAEAHQLAGLGADQSSAIVMTGDPVQFSVTTGYSAVALPGNGLDAITQAADDLHATHVMLNTEDLPASSDEVSQRLHPVRSVMLPAEHTWILELPPGGGVR